MASPTVAHQWYRGGRRQGRKLAGASLKVISHAADQFIDRGDGVVVLIYHRVGGGTDSNVDLPIATFERQMAELAEQQRVISLPRATELLRERPTVSEPPKAGPPVVITFDDGTPDWATNVLPVLDRFDIPATFYVATEFVDQQVNYPDGRPPISWAALEELQGSGLATIGSHTHRHRLLDRADRLIAIDELDRATDCLGTNLGISVEHFAYPKALLGSPEAEAAVVARHQTAALAGTRINRYGYTNLHRLARSPIQNSDTPRWFTAKAAGGLHLEDAVRGRINRHRYAEAVT